MAFLESQAPYARHGVALFPVHIEADGSKRPRRQSPHCGKGARR